MKIGKNIESRPINLIGVVALFFFILFAEMVLGGIFYSWAIEYAGANFHWASVIINGGLILTKGLILLSLMRLVFYGKKEASSLSAKEEAASVACLGETAAEIEHLGEIAAKASTFNWRDALKGACFIGLSVLLYRMAFDSVLGTFLVDWFGISGDLDWSMRLILGAPLLGYSYILLTAPLFEEIIYRGIFYDGLRKKGHSLWTASLFSALLFAVMHLNVVQGVNAFLLGLLTAYVYERSQKLIAPILFHIINNLYVTFFSTFIVKLQWLNLPLRLLMMAASVLLLVLLLGFWGKEKAAQS